MKFGFSILTVASLVAITLLPAIGSATASLKKSQLTARGYLSNSHAEIDRSLDHGYPQRIARRAIYKRTPETQKDNILGISTNNKLMKEHQEKAADYRKKAKAALTQGGMKSRQQYHDAAMKQAKVHDDKAEFHRHEAELHTINLAKKKKQGLP